MLWQEPDVISSGVAPARVNTFTGKDLSMSKIDVHELSDRIISERSSRRRLLGRAAALGISLSAVSGLATHGATFAVAQDASPVPVPGGTLNVALQADPTTLDPLKAGLTAIWKVIEYVNDGVIRVDPKRHEGVHENLSAMRQAGLRGHERFPGQW